MFIKNEAKITSRVYCIKWAGVNFSELLFESNDENLRVKRLTDIQEAIAYRLSKTTEIKYRGQISDSLTTCNWCRAGQGKAKRRSLLSVQPRTKPLMYFWWGAA